MSYDRQAVRELIKRRRAQMLIHSCIYYELDSNIISDHLWQEWADELEQLQTKYPNECKLDFYDKNFEGWTGATGNHLPHRDPWVYGRSRYLLELHQRYQTEGQDWAKAAERESLRPKKETEEVPTTIVRAERGAPPKKPGRTKAKPTEPTVPDKPSLFD